MEFRLLHILAYLSVITLVAMAVVGSHGTSMSSQEAYWKSVLPNTPIPKAITELLQPAAGPVDGKSVIAKDIANGKKLLAGGGNKRTPLYGEASDENYKASIREERSVAGDLSVRINKGNNRDYNGGGNQRYGSGSNADYLSVGITGGRNRDYGGGGNQRYGSGSNADYLAATGNLLDDDLKVAPYFLEKDMRLGASINVHFTKSMSSATFLPRQEADAIPFSSSKFLETLKRFSVKPGSTEAEIMKSTISECEGVALKGEEKYCATSLESMIDFTTSKLGKQVDVISTETETEVNKETTFQKYTITEVTKMGGDKSVVCHKNVYPYAVYYCHKILRTTPYMVSLVGVDGTKVKAAVVCHSDTSAWNPRHVAFKVLKVKPGSATICHYLRMDTIVWVPKY